MPYTPLARNGPSTPGELGKSHAATRSSMAPSSTGKKSRRPTAAGTRVIPHSCTPRWTHWASSAAVARALPAGHEDHQEHDRAVDHCRRLHHQRRAYRAFGSSRAEPDPGRRHHPRSAGDGADYYDSPERVPSPDAPTMGIGHGAWIERTIVDKNARIGDDVRISPDGSRPFDGRQLPHPAMGSSSSPRTR